MKDSNFFMCLKLAQQSNHNIAMDTDDNYRAT